MRMARISLSFSVLFFLTDCCFFANASQSDPKIGLRERVDPNRVIRTASAMTAEGTYLLDPAADPNLTLKPEEIKPETLKIQVQTRLVVQDRWQLADKADSASAGVLLSRRMVELAETKLGGQIRASQTSLRADRRRFLVDIHEEHVRHGSLDGTISRQELEALTQPGDGITLWTLLPKTDVATGDRYKLDTLAAKSLTLFDLIAVNALEGKIEKVTDQTVEIQISGDVRGAVLGAEGKMTITGRLTFNREQGFVDFLRVERDESRRPGNVEAGLEIHSKLEVRRSVMDTIPESLSDESKRTWPGVVEPEHLRLFWSEPSGLFTLEHARDWHVTWTDTQETVMKRVDRGGAVVAQFNLKKGAVVQPGHHQDPQQFRDDVQKAMGQRFRRIFGEGILNRRESEGFGYKLAIEGVIQELPVVWYYYLMASPAGDQYLGTVTTMASELETSQKDGLALMESLRWIPQPSSNEGKKADTP